jgi:hypothetical protein
MYSHHAAPWSPPFNGQYQMICGCIRKYYFLPVIQMKKQNSKTRRFVTGQDITDHIRAFANMVVQLLFITIHPNYKTPIFFPYFVTLWTDCNPPFGRLKYPLSLAANFRIYELSLHSLSEISVSGY